MIDEIEEILKDHREIHSDFQIKHFIIGSQGSAWFQFKQCLREIAARYQSQKDLYAKYELLKIEVEELRKKVNECPAKRAIQIQAKQDQVDGIFSKIKDIERELKTFMALVEKIKKQFDLNDLTDDKYEAFEAMAWFEKAVTMIALDLLASNGQVINRQTWEFINCFPSRLRKMLLSYVVDGQGRDRLIEKFINEEKLNYLEVMK